MLHSSGLRVNYSNMFTLHKNVATSASSSKIITELIYFYELIFHIYTCKSKCNKALMKFFL